MTSQTFSLCGNSSELDCYLFPPVEVKDTSEIGLLSVQTYNSIPNVEPGRNTLGVNIGDAVNTTLICIPTGCYEIFSLESVIRELLTSVNRSIKYFELGRNASSLKCTLRCSHPINFNVNDSIASILGFEKRILSADVLHESDTVVKITPVNCIKVDCNLALGSFENGEQSHTIHEFYPVVAPGYKIVEVPRHCVLYKLKTSTVEYIKVQLKDQNGKLINFRGETVNVRLLIKEHGTEI